MKRKENHSTRVMKKEILFARAIIASKLDPRLAILCGFLVNQYSSLSTGAFCNYLTLIVIAKAQLLSLVDINMASLMVGV